MKKGFWLATAASFAFAAAPSLAQDTDPAADDTTTEENADGVIIVTAQGRAQELADVPLSISAVNADSLQNSGANDIRQLNQLAPSLLVSSTGSEANGSARIRGIGTVGDNPGLESSVAVFIDGVYRSRSGIGLNELGEIERVEVQRGPQGTLGGRNASAGVLAVFSKKPNFNGFAGTGEVTYGNHDYWRVGVGLNIPMGENLAGRIDGVWSRRDGFYTDVISGDDVNNRNRFFVRGQLLYEPSSDVSFRLIGDYTRRKEACCAAVYTETRETYDPTPGVLGDFAYRLPGEGGSPSGNRITDILTSLGGVFPSAGNPYNRLIATTPGRSFDGKTTDWGLSGELNWDLGGAKLTWITGYRQYKSSQAGDVDYGNVDILYRSAGNNAFRQFKTLTTEVRLQGTALNDKLDWLVGGYFASEKLLVRDDLKFGSQYGIFAACRLVASVSPNPALRNVALPGCMSATGRTTLTGALGAAAPLILSGLDRLSTVVNVGDQQSNYHQKSTNFAFFTHNIFSITDDLKLTLGGRFTSEKKNFRADFNNNNTICPVQQAAFSAFLPGGATPLPNVGVNGYPATSVQAIAQGIVNLTCQGNSSSSLNALNLRDSRSEDEFTGTAILSYKPHPDWMTYASYSKGYKAGGFNLDRSALGSPIFSPTDPRNTGGRGAPFGTGNLQFDAEKVDAFELGVKYAGRGVSFSAAVFHQRFSDFQLNTFNGSVFLVQNINGCGVAIGNSTTNGITLPADQDASTATGACPAGEVKPGVISQGLELEASVRPHQDINITAGLTISDTKYKKDLVGRNTGAPLDPALFLLPGSALSNAPRQVFTGSFAWTPAIGNSGLSGLFYVDGRVTSDYNTGSDLFTEKAQDGFGLFNARVGVRGPDERWSVEFWAQNLTNTKYQQVAFNTPFQGGNSIAQVQQFGAQGTTSAANPLNQQANFGTANQYISSFLAEPRTFGITLRGKF